MACSLSPSPDQNKSHFTAQPGPVTLKTAPTQGNIIFTSQSAITDEAGNNVAFTLQNNNQSIQFTAGAGHIYTVFLLYAFLPSSSVGNLVEDCTGSALNIRLINPNIFTVLLIKC